MVIKSDNISAKMLMNKIDSVQSLSNHEKKEWKRIIPVLDITERNRLFEYFYGLCERELEFEIKIIAKHELTDEYDEICEDVTKKLV